MCSKASWDISNFGTICIALRLSLRVGYAWRKMFYIYVINLICYEESSFSSFSSFFMLHTQQSNLSYTYNFQERLYTLSGKKCRGFNQSGFLFVGRKFRHIEAFSSLSPDQKLKFVTFPRPNLQFSHFHPTKMSINELVSFISLKKFCNSTVKALIFVIQDVKILI